MKGESELSKSTLVRERERERLADIKDPQHQKDHPRWREAPTREWIQDETLSITSANFCLLWEFHTV